MTVLEMTRKEFAALRHREWDEDIGPFDSLVILPGRIKDGLHDSGYRIMDFVAVKAGEPICLLAGGSDVIHIEGIYGDGVFKLNDTSTGGNYIDPPKGGWSIDCLPKSGLLQLFKAGCWLVAGNALSSFEIWSMKREETR